MNYSISCDFHEYLNKDILCSIFGCMSHDPCCDDIITDPDLTSTETFDIIAIFADSISFAEKSNISEDETIEFVDKIVQIYMDYYCG